MIALSLGEASSPFHGPSWPLHTFPDVTRSPIHKPQCLPVVSKRPSGEAGKLVLSPVGLAGPDLCSAKSWPLVDLGWGDQPLADTWGQQAKADNRFQQVFLCLTSRLKPRVFCPQSTQLQPPPKVCPPHSRFIHPSPLQNLVH